MEGTAIGTTSTRVRTRAVIAAGAAAILVATACSAEPSEAPLEGADTFFTGKTIEFIVPFGEGGGNDLYARTVADHISKYIPGNPRTRVVNMPGASGRVAYNHFYNTAARDGTVIVGSGPALELQLAGDPGFEADLTKMIPLGAAGISVRVMVMRTDVFGSLEEAIASSPGKKAKVGTAGPITGNLLHKLVELVIGKKDVFTDVSGYDGTAEFLLAVRRGEVDTTTTGMLPVLDGLGDMINAGDVAILLQSGLPPDGRRSPELPNVPSFVEFAKAYPGAIEGADKIALAALPIATSLREFLTTPDVPADRVAVLRDALSKTLKDADFLAQAEKSNLPIDPVSAEDLETLLIATLQGTPAVLQQFMATTVSAG